MISLFLSSILAAAEPPPVVHIFGIGNETCEAAFGADRVLEREVWIMGYWSGLNAAAGKEVGKTLSIFDIFPEVERRCRTAPSEMLMQVVLDLWRSMQLRYQS